MPYYKWKGVTLNGTIKSGKMFAVNQEALDQFLFNRDIALIKIDSTHTMLVPSITLKTQAQLFGQLATLLDAGILVPQALSLVRDTIGHVRMQLLLADITADVERGLSLSAALERHTPIFNERTVQMVYIGQESGSLPITVKTLAVHLETVIAFREKIKSASMTPLISFAFFIVIVLIIIIFVMPTMAAVFSSVNQPMPLVTKAFLAISQFLKSWYGLLITCVGLGLGYVGIRKLLTRDAIKRTVDQYILKVPFFGKIIIDTQRAWYLESVALLISGGMQLVPALRIAQRSFTNGVLQEQGKAVQLAVASGSSFSKAMSQISLELFPYDCIAIIQVGEDAGALASALEKAAADSRNRALRHIGFVSRIIQPALLVILGLMITLLILAIYTPILTISWSIH